KQLLDRVWNEKLSVEQSLGVRKMIPVIPGDSLKDRGVLISEGAHEKVFALLFDSQSNGNMGGTGTTFDCGGTPAMVQVISLKIPVIVVGGLTAFNVAEGIRLLQPFGVAVSSGVEARAGEKDPGEVLSFI